jgi:acetyl-CoA carboxylase carboxyltransferase component
MHAFQSGVCDDLAPDEQQAIARVREIVAHANRARDLAPPHAPCAPRHEPDEIAGLIPAGRVRRPLARAAR